LRPGTASARFWLGRGRRRDAGRTAGGT
jgi:hypothetical protein